MTNDLNTPSKTDHSVTSYDFEEDAPRINKPSLFKLADDAIKLWLEADLAVAQTRNEHARAKYEGIFRFAWSAINIDPAAFKNINKVKVDKRCADDQWRLPVKYLLEMTKRLYCERHGSPEAKAEYPSSTLAKAVDLVRIAAKAGIEPDGFGAWWDQYKGVNDILDRYKVKSAARPKSKTVISLSKRQWRIIQRAVVGLASEDEKAKARVLVEDAIHSIDEPDADDSEKVDAVDDGNDALTAADDETVDATDHDEHLSADEQLADDDAVPTNVHQEDGLDAGGAQVTPAVSDDHGAVDQSVEAGPTKKAEPAPMKDAAHELDDLLEMQIAVIHQLDLRDASSELVMSIRDRITNETDELLHKKLETLWVMIQAQQKTADDDTDPDDDPPPSGGEPVPTGDNDHQEGDTDAGEAQEPTEAEAAPSDGTAALLNRIVDDLDEDSGNFGEVDDIAEYYENKYTDEEIYSALAEGLKAGLIFVVAGSVMHTVNFTENVANDFKPFAASYVDLISYWDWDVQSVDAWINAAVLLKLITFAHGVVQFDAIRPEGAVRTPECVKKGRTYGKYMAQISVENNRDCLYHELLDKAACTDWCHDTYTFVKKFPSITQAKKFCKKHSHQYAILQVEGYEHEFKDITELDELGRADLVKTAYAQFRDEATLYCKSDCEYVLRDYDDPTWY